MSELKGSLSDSSISIPPQQVDCLTPPPSPMLSQDATLRPHDKEIPSPWGQPFEVPAAQSPFPRMVLSPSPPSLSSVSSQVSEEKQLAADNLPSCRPAGGALLSSTEDLGGLNPDLIPPLKPPSPLCFIPEQRQLASEIQALISTYIAGRPLSLITTKTIAENLLLSCYQQSVCLASEVNHAFLGNYRIIGLTVSF